MPFARPTLSGLIAAARAALARALGAVGLLRFSPEDALAVVQAGLTDGLHKHLDWIARESVPYDADGENLEAWANLVGVIRKPPVAASGSVIFPATDGSVLPAGSVVNRGDAGASYVTTADATAAGGSVTAPVVASVAGVASNADPGIAVALQGAVAGVSSSGIVATVIAGGADQEDDDAFRLRMLLRWASPPQGGAASDYLQWALAVPGVTRAWVLPLGMGPGTVVIYSMWDSSEAAHGGFPQGSNGVAALETRDTPATGDQLILANAVYPERPVTALVYSFAPAPYPVAMSLHAAGVIPVGLRPAIEAAIDTVFLAYGSALSIEIETAPFVAAIAGVQGMPPFTLTLPPVLAPVGALPVRGVVTYA